MPLIISPCAVSGLSWKGLVLTMFYAQFCLIKLRKTVINAPVKQLNYYITEREGVTLVTVKKSFKTFTMKMLVLHLAHNVL